MSSAPALAAINGRSSTKRLGRTNRFKFAQGAGAGELCSPNGRAGAAGRVRAPALRESGWASEARRLGNLAEEANEPPDGKSRWSLDYH